MAQFGWKHSTSITPPAIVRPPNGPLHDTYVACIATAPNGRQFDRTLIGLGKRPLPLA